MLTSRTYLLCMIITYVGQSYSAFCLRPLQQPICLFVLKLLTALHIPWVRNYARLLSFIEDGHYEMRNCMVLGSLQKL